MDKKLFRTLILITGIYTQMAPAVAYTRQPNAAQTDTLRVLTQSLYNQQTAQYTMIGIEEDLDSMRADCYNIGEMMKRNADLQNPQCTSVESKSVKEFKVTCTCKQIGF